MHEGTIVTVVVERGFGFIKRADMPDTFFHAKQLDPELSFDETLMERRVRFEIEHSPRGMRAINVRAAV